MVYRGAFTKLNQPETIKIKYKCNPEQGLAALLAVMVAPKGYEFFKMDRKDTEAVVTYKLKVDDEGT
jgi:hypothetical protein